MSAFSMAFMIDLNRRKLLDFLAFSVNTSTEQILGKYLMDYVQANYDRLRVQIEQDVQKQLENEQLERNQLLKEKETILTHRDGLTMDSDQWNEANTQYLSCDSQLQGAIEHHTNILQKHNRSIEILKSVKGEKR